MARSREIPGDRISVLMQMLVDRQCREPDTLLDLCRAVCRFDRTSTATALRLTGIATTDMHLVGSRATFEIVDHGQVLDVDEAPPYAKALGRVILAAMNGDTDSMNIIVVAFKETCPEQMPELLASLTIAAHNTIHAAARRIAPQQRR